MTEEKDLGRFVHELHHQATITITTSLTPENETAWTYTVTGEDFLDGSWSETYTGTSRRGKRLLVAIDKELVRRRNARRKGTR